MYANHVVRITGEGHQPVTTEVRLRAGQVETIEVTLQPLAATDPPAPAP
jgi:hypothetical protein